MHMMLNAAIVVTRTLNLDLFEEVRNNFLNMGTKHWRDWRYFWNFWNWCACMLVSLIWIQRVEKPQCANFWSSWDNQWYLPHNISQFLLDDKCEWCSWILRVCIVFHRQPPYTVVLSQCHNSIHIENTEIENFENWDFCLKTIYRTLIPKIPNY